MGDFFSNFCCLLKSQNIWTLWQFFISLEWVFLPFYTTWILFKWHKLFILALIKKIFWQHKKIPFKIEGKFTIRIHGIFLSSINRCHFLQTPLHLVKLLLSNFSNIFSIIWGNLSIKKESSILKSEFYLK